MKYVAWFLLVFGPVYAAAAQGVTAQETKQERSDWSLNFGLSQVIGSGTFSHNEYVRSSSDYVGQSLNLGLAYRGLHLFEQPVTLSVRSSLDIEWTAPTHGGRRRLSLNDTRLSLHLPTLWREPLTGMELGFKTSLLLPTSISSYRVKKQILVATLGADLSGRWGIFSLDIGFQASKFAGATIGTHYGIRPAGCGLPTSASAEEFTPDCSAELIGQQAGFPNVSVALATTFAVGIELFDHLNLSYSLGLRNYFKYAVADDERSSINAIGGIVRRDYFSPSWTLSYPLSQKIELPIELSLFADASAFHSMRTADRQRVFVPMVFNTFGKLAADGYGSLSLGFSGSW